MKKRKALLFGLIVVLTILSLVVITSCNDSKKEAEKEKEAVEETQETPEESKKETQKELKIGYVTMMMAADSNSRAYDAFEKKAKEKSWKVFMTDAAGDIVKVSEGVMNYVSQGVDVVIISCAEITPIGEGLKAAKDAGIPVFSLDTGVDEDGAVVANVTSNGWAMGAEVAAQMVNHLNGKGNVCIIDIPTLNVHRYRADTARAVFESSDNPDIKILAQDSVTVSNWESGSYEIMNAWITKYGNEIDAVFGTWDGIGWSVAKAAADSGFEKEDMFAMAIDGTRQTYDMIRSGKPFTGVVAQDFGGWALKTVELIDDIVVKGKSADEVVPTGRIIYVPHKWIDATNVPEQGADPQSIFN